MLESYNLKCHLEDVQTDVQWSSAYVLTASWDEGGIGPNNMKRSPGEKAHVRTKAAKTRQARTMQKLQLGNAEMEFPLDPTKKHRVSGPGAFSYELGA